MTTQLRHSASWPQQQVTGLTEEVVKTPEGLIVPIPKRSRRGRKSRRKSSHPLRDIRLSRGFTLEELAELSQLSPSYLSRLESGTRRLNVDTIHRLSTALQCSPSDLLVTATQVHPGAQPAYETRQGSSAAMYGYPTNVNQTTFDQTGQNQLALYGPTAGTSKVDFAKPIGAVACPPELTGIPGAYAYAICDDNMVPRYRRGDRVLVHPGRPLTPQSTAVVITANQEVIVGEFMAWRHVSEVDMGANSASDASYGEDNPYVLQLKQYNATTTSVGHTVPGEAGIVYVYPAQISSVGRVVGTVEGS